MTHTPVPVRITEREDHAVGDTVCSPYHGKDGPKYLDCNALTIEWIGRHINHVIVAGPCLKDGRAMTLSTFDHGRSFRDVDMDGWVTLQRANEEADLREQIATLQKYYDADDERTVLWHLLERLAPAVRRYLDSGEEYTPQMIFEVESALEKWERMT